MLRTFEAAERFSYDQQERLVREVCASPDCRQETHWLEWKRTLELSDKEGQAKVAKAVLGFANRSPATASEVAGGYGYLIVGAGPTSLDGVARVDAAALEDGIGRYVGRKVQWRADYVRQAGRDVLVVTVAPPRWGDPLHPLQKSFQGERFSVSEGAIFVRRQAATTVADAKDIEMLNERMARRRSRSHPVPLMAPEARREQFRIQVGANPRVLCLDRLDLSHAARDEYVHTQAAQTMPRYEAARRGRPRVVRSSGPRASQSDAGDTALRRPGDAQYAARPAHQMSVEGVKLSELSSRLLPTVMASAVGRDMGALSLTLHNRTDMTFVGVELELAAPVGCGIFERRDILAMLPQSPNREQQTQLFRTPLVNAATHSSEQEYRPRRVPLKAARRRVTRPAQPEKFVFDAVTVRAGRSVPLPKVHLVVVQTVRPGIYPLQWSATATNAPKRIDGTVEMVVADAVWTPHQLLAA